MTVRNIERFAAYGRRRTWLQQTGVQTHISSEIWQL